MEEIKLPKNYKHIRVPAEDKLCIQIAINSKSKFHEWLAELSNLNNISWRSEKGAVKLKSKLSLSFVCHHANFGQKGIRTTNTK